MTDITKALATMEDLACGKGKVTQERGGVSYQLGKINIAYAVTTEDDLALLDTTKFTLAELNNTIYIYSPTMVAGGVKSLRGAGSWVAAPVTTNVKNYVDGVVANVAGQAAVDANKMIEQAFARNFAPKDGTNLEVGDTVNAGVDAVRIGDVVRYLVNPVSNTGALTAFDSNTITVNTTVYRTVPALPVQAAVNSATPESGFGGFRYTITNNPDGTKTLNLFTS